MLRAVPVIGSSLEHFLFGPASELRLRRLDRTLKEVAEELRARGASPRVDTEEFARLLEGVLPRLSRATNEDVRMRLRDLLLNATALPAASPRWEEAELARQLIEEIDGPGLAIVAALGRCPDASRADWSARPVPQVSLVSRPVPQIVTGELDWDNLPSPTNPLGYEWAVVEEWAHRLRERRVILYHSGDARGGFGGIMLSHLGLLLVRWSLADSALSAT